jgi:serine/threonine protein kinase
MAFPPLSTTMIGSGRYRVHDHLGSGGMAHVYRGRHLDLGIDVAIKLLHASAASHDVVRRFQQEARVMASLDHPGCVRVLDIGRTSGGDHYLVMDLLDGPTLRELLDRQGVSLAQAVNIGVQLLEALAHVHHRGILHRDIKPANILYSRRRDTLRPVLIDFGLAKPISASLNDEPTAPLALGSPGGPPAVPRRAELAARAPQTVRGLCWGSPSYIAPERLRNERHDARSDVYSVGVLLYEMLTGSRPFVGETEAVVIAALQQTPPPPGEINPRVSPALDAIVSRALEKEPERRFRDAAEMGQALAEVVLSAADSRAHAFGDDDEQPTQRLAPEPSSAARRAWTWLRHASWRRSSELQVRG